MPINYFENPTIKISIPHQLNDPFECIPSENIYKLIKRNLKKVQLDEHVASGYLDSYKTSIMNMLSLNGIVSFSETPRNFLMWAHYGNHHKGMCIGLNRNLFNEVTIPDNEFKITNIEPRKVNYDNFRFSSDSEFIADNREDVQAIERHFLTKSDEWIYEKEHRSIVPYMASTRIVLTTDKPKPVDNCGSDMRIEDVIDYMLDHNMIIPTDNKKIYLCKDNTNGEGAYSYLQQSEGEVMFLIDIPPKYIESIYFGCKVSDQYIYGVHSQFKSSKSKVKIYKFKTSKTRFELTPTIINDRYFKSINMHPKQI